MHNSYNVNKYAIFAKYNGNTKEISKMHIYVVDKHIYALYNAHVFRTTERQEVVS